MYIKKGKSSETIRKGSCSRLRRKCRLRGAFLHALLDPQHQVDEPVDLNHPAFLPADLDLVQQVALRLVLAAADRQRLTDVLYVLLAGQLRHPWMSKKRLRFESWKTFGKKENDGAFVVWMFKSIHAFSTFSLFVPVTNFNVFLFGTLYDRYCITVDTFILIRQINHRPWHTFQIFI